MHTLLLHLPVAKYEGPTGKDSLLGTGCAGISFLLGGLLAMAQFCSSPECTRLFSRFLLQGIFVWFC